jgi:nucleoside-diphosphate-sugar epimerase
MTVSDHPPPADGSDGYAAGKWASERFLERLDEQFTGGWPVFVHRPSLISRPLEDPASDLAHNVRHFAARLKASPMITHMHGYLNTVSLQDVVSGIVGSLSVNDATVSGVRYRHYFGEEKLPLDDPVTALFGPADGERRRNLGEIEELPPKEWAKRAGELGMPQAVVQWVESVDLQREQWFPELLR